MGIIIGSHANRQFVTKYIYIYRRQSAEAIRIVTQAYNVKSSSPNVLVFNTRSVRSILFV